MPTALPLLDFGSSELSVDQSLISSMDEPVAKETYHSIPYARGLKFFLVYTTMISYSFVSTTITKAVNLVTTPAAAGGAGALLCKPAGYVVC